MDKNKKYKRKIYPGAAYATYALADEETFDPETRTTTPTERGVLEAKEFVDENKK